MFMCGSSMYQSGWQHRFVLLATATKKLKELLNDIIRLRTQNYNHVQILDFQYARIQHCRANYVPRAKDGLHVN